MHHFHGSVATDAPSPGNIKAALAPLLGSFRDWARTPEEWLYTVLACPLIGALRSVPFRSARNQRWRRGQAPQGWRWSPCASVQVCFSPLSPCKNGHPETTRNPCATGLRLQISLSSIDRCPPFRAKRTDRGGNNNRLKNLCNFFPAEPPPSRLVQDDGSRKLPQIISLLTPYRQLLNNYWSQHC